MIYERVYYRKNGRRSIKLYTVWMNMRRRCQSEYRHDYEHYGGRGITVTEEWFDFAVFRKWALAAGYRKGLSIDRIDNDGNYEPGNCRWATPKEQRANQRERSDAKLNPEKAASIRGDDRPYSQIAADYGVSVSMISMIKTGKYWRTDD